MYYFPWCLLLLFGFTASEDITPNVTIVWEENVLSLKYRPTILIDNKPFKIIVDLLPSNAGYTSNIQCYYNNTKHINTKLTQYEGRYVAEVMKANTKMTNTWQCSVTQKLPTKTYSNIYSVTFSVHVRFTEMQGEMRVNGRNIKLYVTDLSVSDYDAVGTYYYRDGELANISCHKLRNNIYNIHTLFFNISDTQHKIGTDKKDVNLYLKLGHRHSPKHIDCVLRKLHRPDHNNNIRLMLKPFTGEIDYPQFQVNGLSLTPSKHDSDHNYVFIYEYYSGEDLTVMSNLDLNIYKSMSCAGVNLPNDIKLDRDEITELILNISTNQFAYPQASVDCLVYRNNNMLQERISVKFIEDTMKFTPSITGIQWSKIIAKFNDNINSTHSEGTIYASYNSNDMTQYCSCNKTDMKWNYDSIVNSTLLTASPNETHFIATINEHISSRTFQLPKNFSKITLECKNGFNKTSKVVLIQQELTKPTIQDDSGWILIGLVVIWIIEISVIIAQIVCIWKQIAKSMKNLLT